MGGCFGCFCCEDDDDAVVQSKHTSEIGPTYFEQLHDDPNINKKAEDFIARFHESCDKGAENGSMAEKASINEAFKLYLRVPAMKADEVVKFYEAAFGAERRNHHKVKAEQELPSSLCAELKIGSFFLLICDQTEDSSAPTGEGAIVFRVEMEDVEGAVEKAVKAGAELLKEGARGRELVAKVKDPFGVVWYIASASKKRAGAEAEADA